jgi:hypothetical protein
MNKPNSSAQQQDVNTCNAEPHKFGPNTAGNVLSFLYQRVDTFGKLEADELEFLARSSESASHMAFALANTLSNIGCVIDADYTPGRTRAGNFEVPDNVSSLLFVVADQVRVISELAQIGDDAASTLLYRERGNV